MYSLLSFKILEEKILLLIQFFWWGIVNNTMQISSLDEEGQKGMSSTLIQIHYNAIFSIPPPNTFISSR